MGVAVPLAFVTGNDPGALLARRDGGIALCNAVGACRCWAIILSRIVHDRSFDDPNEAGLIASARQATGARQSGGLIRSSVQTGRKVMEKNVGSGDRLFRIVVAVLLIALIYLVPLTGLAAVIAGIAAVGPARHRA